MLGSLLSKIRKEKNITKVSVAREIGIDTGHISHIEKGQRNPSHKTLRNMCKSLGIPYQPIAYTYDRVISEDQERYKLIKHISCEKVPLVDNVIDFIDCPATIPYASFAIKVQTDEMEPFMPKDSKVFVELNANLNNKDVALILLDGKLYMRRFIIRKDKLVLRADNKDYLDIDFNENSDFTIIGRILKN